MKNPTARLSPLTSDPAVLDGAPVFRGTEVPVSALIVFLAEKWRNKKKSDKQNEKFREFYDKKAQELAQKGASHNEYNFGGGLSDLLFNSEENQEERAFSSAENDAEAIPNPFLDYHPWGTSMEEFLRLFPNVSPENVITVLDHIHVVLDHIDNGDFVFLDTTMVWPEVETEPPPWKVEYGPMGLVDIGQEYIDFDMLVSYMASEARDLMEAPVRTPWDEFLAWFSEEKKFLDELGYDLGSDTLHSRLLLGITRAFYLFGCNYSSFLELESIELHPADYDMIWSGRDSHPYDPDKFNLDSLTLSVVRFREVLNCFVDGPGSLLELIKIRLRRNWREYLILYRDGLIGFDTLMAENNKDIGLDSDSTFGYSNLDDEWVPGDWKPNVMVKKVVLAKNGWDYWVPKKFDFHAFFSGLDEAAWREGILTDEFLLSL